MHDTYFVEERSGVIGIPLGIVRSPEYRRQKTNWNSLTTWIHLMICLLAIPLIIWNLFLLMKTIIDYTQAPQIGVDTSPETARYTTVHPLAFLIVICSILMNLLAGVFALVTESACFSEKLAKVLFVMAYSSIAISVLSLVLSGNLLDVIFCIILIIFIVLYGFGFWRFSIISAMYLNEDGPTWVKPAIYGLLAAIPFLSTSTQCLDNKNTVGCLPNEWFGGRVMYNDVASFVILTIITVLSLIPFLTGIAHNEQL